MTTNLEERFVAAMTPTTRGGLMRVKMLEHRGLMAGRVTGRYELAEQGRWRIGRWVVTAEHEAAGELRSQISSSSRGRMVPAGVYTALERGYELRGGMHWTTVMSDTPDELLDLEEFADNVARPEARRILINGLGLGCALRIALQHEHVEHVDVVEIDQDVIALVGPYFADDPRVTIHEADARTIKWPPNTRWDIAWHDIWDNISSDNDFATFHRRYGRRVRWQGSWCREHAEGESRRWERENRWWLKDVR